MNISKIVQEQKSYFATQQTKDISKRKQLLKSYFLKSITKERKTL